jgi:hypothetical protein
MLETLFIAGAWILSLVQAAAVVVLQHSTLM